jgi:hypothetical protein
MGLVILSSYAGDLLRVICLLRESTVRFSRLFFSNRETWYISLTMMMVFSFFFHNPIDNF